MPDPAAKALLQRDHVCRSDKPDQSDGKLLACKIDSSWV